MCYVVYVCCICILAKYVFLAKVETTSFLFRGLFGSASSTFLIDRDFLEQCLKEKLVDWIGVFMAGAPSLSSFDSTTVLPEREKFLLIPALVF